MVSWLAVSFMIMDMILGIFVPAGLLLYFKKKYRLSSFPFCIGCLTMVLFAMVLEQAVHFLVLQSAAGVIIRGSAALTALYGGLMAGVFEECGRFTAMKFVLKKKQDDPHNALMYGAGHGGVEMFILLVFGMINNVIYSVMLNMGKAETLLAPLDPVRRNTLQQAFNTLEETSPFMFLVSPAERIFAITGQVALSVIVWFAVVKKRKGYLLLIAVFLHFILDASAVWIAKTGVPVFAVELEILLVVLLTVLFAKAVWKRENAAGQPIENLEKNSGEGI